MLTKSISLIKYNMLSPSFFIKRKTLKLKELKNTRGFVMFLVIQYILVFLLFFIYYMVLIIVVALIV